MLASIVLRYFLIVKPCSWKPNDRSFELPMASDLLPVSSICTDLMWNCILKLT